MEFNALSLYATKLKTIIAKWQHKIGLSAPKGEAAEVFVEAGVSPTRTTKLLKPTRLGSCSRFADPRSNLRRKPDRPFDRLHLTLLVTATAEMTRSTADGSDEPSAASIIVNMFSGPTRKESTVFFPERFSNDTQNSEKNSSSSSSSSSSSNEVHFSRRAVSYGVGICFESSPNQSLRVAQLEVGCSAYRSGVIERGDEILKVDGEIVEKRQIGLLKERILGQQGQSVTLTFRRDSLFPNLVYEVELMRGGADYMDLVADNKALVLERDSCKDVVRQLQSSVKTYESKMESVLHDMGKYEKLGMKYNEKNQDEVESRRKAEKKLADSMSQIASLKQSNQEALQGRRIAEQKLADRSGQTAELRAINQELQQQMMLQIAKCDFLADSTHTKLHALSAQLKITQKTLAYREAEAKKWRDLAKQMESEIGRYKHGQSVSEQRAESTKSLLQQLQTATDHIAELESEIADKERLNWHKMKTMEDSQGILQGTLRSHEAELNVLRSKLETEQLKRAAAENANKQAQADKGREREIQHLEAELSSQISARRGVEQRVSALEQTLSKFEGSGRPQQPAAVPEKPQGVLASAQDNTDVGVINPWAGLRATQGTASGWDKGGAVVNMPPLPADALPPPSALDFASRPSTAAPRAALPASRRSADSLSASDTASSGAGPGQVSPATSTGSADAQLDLEPVVHAQDLTPRVSALKHKFELHNPASPSASKPSPRAASAPRAPLRAPAAAPEPPTISAATAPQSQGPDTMAVRAASGPFPDFKFQPESLPDLPNGLQLSAAASPDGGPAVQADASEGWIGLSEADDAELLPGVQRISSLATQEKKRKQRSIQFDESNNAERLLTPVTPEDKNNPAVSALSMIPQAFLFPGSASETEEVPYDAAEEELIRLNTQTNAGSMFSFC